MICFLSHIYLVFTIYRYYKTAYGMWSGLHLLWLYWYLFWIFWMLGLSAVAGWGRLQVVGSWEIFCWLKFLYLILTPFLLIALLITLIITLMVYRCIILYDFCLNTWHYYHKIIFIFLWDTFKVEVEGGWLNYYWYKRQRVWYLFLSRWGRGGGEGRYSYLYGYFLPLLWIILAWGLIPTLSLSPYICFLNTFISLNYNLDSLIAFGILCRHFFLVRRRWGGYLAMGFHPREELALVSILRDCGIDEDINLRSVESYEEVLAYWEDATKEPLWMFTYDTTEGIFHEIPACVLNWREQGYDQYFQAPGYWIREWSYELLRVIMFLPRIWLYHPVAVNPFPTPTPSYLNYYILEGQLSRGIYELDFYYNFKFLAYDLLKGGLIFRRLLWIIGRRRWFLRWSRWVLLWGNLWITKRLLFRWVWAVRSHRISDYYKNKDKEKIYTVLWL